MARDIEAGRAFVRVSIKENLAGLKRVSAKLKSWGAGMAGIGMKMAGLGAAIGAPFIATIKAASDMEETMNKFNVVFGDSSKEVKAWSDQFAGSIGRSKKQIADFMAGSQDLFVPLGFAADAALDMSKQVTALATDLASFNNMADEDTLRDLHAALTGSGEVMKKYGVIVSEAAVKQELLNQAIDPKTASDQQKVQARLNIIMRGTTAAQGDAVRSAGSFANQMKALKASIMDTAVSIGTALLPVVTPLITKAASIVTMIGQWISQNTEMVKTIALVAAGIAAAGVAFMGLGGAMATVGVIIGGIVAGISGIIAAIGVLVPALPIIAAVAASIAAAGAGLYYFLTQTEMGEQVMAGFSRAMQEVTSTFKQVWGGIVDAFKAGDLKLAAQIAWAGVMVTYEQFKAGLMHSWNNLRGAWDETWTGMRIIFNDIVTAIETAFSSMIGAVADNLMVVARIAESVLGKIGIETTRLTGTLSKLADSEGRNARLAQANQANNEELAAGLSDRQASRSQGANADLIAAQAELDALVAKAATDRAAKELAAEAMKEEAKPTSPAEVKSQVQDSLGGSSRGTFSAMEAAMFGRTASVEKEIADATKETAETLRRMERNQGEGMAFA